MPSRAGDEGHDGQGRDQVHDEVVLLGFLLPIDSRADLWVGSYRQMRGNLDGHMQNGLFWTWSNDRGLAHGENAVGAIFKNCSMWYKAIGGVRTAIKCRGLIPRRFLYGGQPGSGLDRLAIAP